MRGKALDRCARLGKTADPQERARLGRETGDIIYAGNQTIPVVDLYALYGISQKKVGDRKPTGYYSFTHLEHAQKR